MKYHDGIRGHFKNESDNAAFVENKPLGVYVGTYCNQDNTPVCVTEKDRALCMKSKEV